MLHASATSGRDPRVSNLADGVCQVAFPLSALAVTADPAAFAVVTLMLRLP